MALFAARPRHSTAGIHGEMLRTDIAAGCCLKVACSNLVLYLLSGSTLEMLSLGGDGEFYPVTSEQPFPRRCQEKAIDTCLYVLSY